MQNLVAVDGLAVFFREKYQTHQHTVSNFTADLYRCGMDVVEKQKVKRGQRTSQCRVSRPVKPSSAADDSSASSLSVTTSDQATALALGLGPRFNWLENKINTMQANPTTMPAKPRPVLLASSSVSGSWSSVDGGGGGGPRPIMSTVVDVATVTTSSMSTISSPQSSPLLQSEVVTTESSVNVR